MAAAQYQDIRNRVARQLEGALWMDPADPLNAPENTLWFYGHRASYGCFSNFYHTPIVMGKHTWPTSEHYFQAMKFEHSYKDFKEILHAKGPMEAAKMGRERSRPLRPDWAGVKDDIMFDVVLAKFTQDATIRDILLSTGDLVLVEHTGNDAYWGDGGDGSGKNMLGITLCQVREVLRTFPVEDVAAQAAGPLVPSRVPGVSDIRQAVLDASKNITWVLDNGDQPPNTLHFYRDKSEFGYLSNFFAVPVTFAGAVWPTTEHYFQAMKFEHSKPHYEAVLAAASPMEAKNLGGDRSSPLRKDWEAVKDNIMFDIVFAKFTQVPELRDELLSTGDLVLVEHTKNDSYWGDGGDGTGKNMLGITLMQVRECIRRGFTSF